MDGSVTISLRNFVGEGIQSSSNDNSLNRKPLYEKYILISLYHVYVDNSKIVSIMLNLQVSETFLYVTIKFY
jgi:hypothetical protein